MAKRAGVLYAPTPKKKAAKKKAEAPSWAAKPKAGGRRGMHYHLVIDRSGSMSSWVPRVISSVNEYLGSIDQSIPSTVTIELFDSSGYGSNIQRDFLCRAVVAECATRLTPYNYDARGGTPLHDAVGLAVREVDCMQLPEGVGVAMIIMTDGGENTSKQFNGATVASILKARQDAGWLVIYLGANQDAIHEGGRFGTYMANTMTYDMASMGAALKSTARSSAFYASGLSAAASSFTDEERAEAVGRDKKGR